MVPCESVFCSADKALIFQMLIAHPEQPVLKANTKNAPWHKMCGTKCVMCLGSISGLPVQQTAKDHSVRQVPYRCDHNLVESEGKQYRDRLKSLHLSG
jgi:hypothetical protein